MLADAATVYLENEEREDVSPGSEDEKTLEQWLRAEHPVWACIQESIEEYMRSRGVRPITLRLHAPSTCRLVPAVCGDGSSALRTTEGIMVPEFGTSRGIASEAATKQAEQEHLYSALAFPLLFWEPEGATRDKETTLQRQLKNYF